MTYLKRPLDPEAVKFANSAIAKKTGGRPLSMGPEDSALREEWAENYREALAKAGRVAPESKGKSTTKPAAAISACDSEEPPRENVVLVGSEMSYNLFWLKMMFIASAFRVLDRDLLRRANQQTLLFVDEGYTKAEKLPLEFLVDQHGVRVVSIATTAELVQYMNTRPLHQDCKRRVLLQDVIFFCHGYPGVIDLNYKGHQAVRLDASSLASIGTDVFVADGRIGSYACRTGNGSYWTGSFQSDADALPEESLAQKMADHFGVEVRAFLTKSFYGNVLRASSDSKRIADALKAARIEKEGSVIQIPPDHEALPHAGLSEGGILSRTDEEGTNDYALWRKRGAIDWPESADEPAGLSRAPRIFLPRKPAA